MLAPDIQALVRDRRAGPALRFLQSPDAAKVSAEERMQLEAVALPLLSEQEIEQKWVGWLSAPHVSFALLVQQLAKRLLSLTHNQAGVFAERLHTLLQTALQKGTVSPGVGEKLEEHKQIIYLLAPHLPLLQAPKPVVVKSKEVVMLPAQEKSAVAQAVADKPYVAKTVPPPPNIPIEPPQPVPRRSPKPALQSLPQHAPVRPSIPQKQIVDIRSPKTFGPLDELRALRVEDFRRLGETMEERTQKIVTMVGVAGHDGVKERRDALRAWFDSPVMQLHRMIGFASLGTNQGVEQEIQQRQERGEPTLTKEEFEGLTDVIDKL